MATETGNGGGEFGGGSITLPNGAQFLLPRFGTTPWFPYADLQSQMVDAQQNWAKGAGQFANNNTPINQGLRSFSPTVGGGLLGKSAYSGGPNPFLAGFQQPSSGFNPFLGRAIGGGAGGGASGGAGGPAGTPTIPGGYAPGAPMPRSGAPVAPGTPGRGGAPIMPTIPSPGGLLQPFQQPGARTGPGTTPPPTGAGGRSTGTPPAGTPGASAGGAPLPYQPGAQFNPGTGETSVSSMLAYFNSLPQEQRGNYINAIDQYSLGKGGAANLGAALQQALRGQMGQQNFDSWYATNVTNKQGSGVGREGLPSWLLSALGG